MPPRVRFALWALAVAGCGLSPVLFRLVAPWAGAAWQCACLGGILALYATTPAGAIRLPPWLSKVLIVGGMAAWPWLCYGRVTWALVVAPLAVFVFDHLPLTMSRPVGKRGIHIAARWSWHPGVASDWLATILLWSPAMWPILGGNGEPGLPEWALPASVCSLLFVLVLQLPERPATPSPDDPAPRIPERLGMSMVFLGIGALAAVAMAFSPGM